jgi:hypothetical protein
VHVGTDVQDAACDVGLDELVVRVAGSISAKQP